jgi:hypothetical protein
MDKTQQEFCQSGSTPLPAKSCTSQACSSLSKRSILMSTVQKLRGGAVNNRNAAEELSNANLRFRRNFKCAWEWNLQDLWEGFDIKGLAFGTTPWENKYDQNHCHCFVLLSKRSCWSLNSEASVLCQYLSQRRPKSQFYSAVHSVLSGAYSSDREALYTARDGSS